MFNLNTNPDASPNCFGVYSENIRECSCWNFYLRALRVEKIRSDICTKRAGVPPYLWYVSNNGCIASLSQELFAQLPHCQKPKVFKDPVNCVKKHIAQTP